MPEISRFFGVVIRMFAEPGAPHHLAHFHVYYQDSLAIYGIEPVQMIEGSLPQRQQRLVEAWAELHQGELMKDWETLQEGKSPAPIAPLR